MRKKQKKQNFSDRLRQVREERGITRSGLAHSLGLSDSTQISRYESSKAFPPVPTIQKLAEILNVDLHWLITGENSPNIKAVSAGIKKHLCELSERIKLLEDEGLSLDLANRFRGVENEDAISENERQLSCLKAEYNAIRSILKKGWV